MKHLTKLAITIALSVSATSHSSLAQNRAHGDHLRIPIGSQASHITIPERGLSKSQVRNQFGEPNERSRTVGKPPISQWHYPEFTVYFEYSHVVHAVRKAR